ncbi:MAG: type I secretion C-terminal target domain-containing protein, partial [Rhodoferax sp.]|nr:type I secretion C-terminal target domain-containing protein [Rhodoferax sp.]
GDNETHATVQGTNSLFEDLTVSLTDRDDDNTTGTLSVNIVDDVVDAIADANVGTASENAVTLTGNVLGNDVQGADGAAVTPATLTGTYGSITIGSNGAYTYTLNPADADFTALVGDATGSETFTYTLTDADGDTDTAVLTLNIKNDDDGVTITDLTPKAEGGDVTVNENDLLAARAEGESAGSDTTPESTTQGGSFTITAADGVKTLTIGGLTVISNGLYAGDGTSGSTPLGNTLTITGYNAATGQVSYTYTLGDNETHATVQGTNSLFEDLTVSLTDRDDDNTTGTLSVNIVDDGPSVTANAVADSGITLTTRDSLTIDPLTDTASANFAVALLASATPVYGADGAGGTVLSAYTLVVTSTASGLSSHGVPITLAKVGDDVVGSAGAMEIFRISVNIDGTVTLLTQSAQIDHVGVGNNLQIALADGKISLNATATTTDGDGDTATAMVSVDLGGNIIFIDDVPTINSVQHGVVDNEGGLSINGQILANPGADGIAAYQFDPATTTAPSGLTYTLSNSNTQLVATDGTGETVFTVNVNENGTYDFVLVKPAPESVAVTPPFSTLNIPNHTDSYTVNLYGSYTSAGVGIGPVLGTVTFSDTKPLTEDLSVSQDGLGINNNLMNVGELLVMTFDTPVSNATFNIGNFSNGDTLVWKVYDIDGVTVLDSGTIDQFFYDANGVQVNLVNAENLDYSINLATNGLDSGLLFTSMSLESSNNSFKFTGFSVEKALTVADQTYNFGVVAVDNDGDTTVSSSFSVLVDGTGNDLVGTAGSDVINAGAGNDTLTGGAGADVFKWSLGDQGGSGSPAIDHITDFDVSVNGATALSTPSTGDTLDLRDLLNVTETATDLAPYLKFELVGGKLALAVDHDGGGIFEATEKIVLDNYSGADVAAARDALGTALGLSGSGFSDADIITKMIADGHLKTDI